MQQVRESGKHNTSYQPEAPAFVQEPGMVSAKHSPDGNIDSRSSAPKVVLSCDLCRQRKVRCDKGDPCSTCVRAGVKCAVVNRQRLPRGRNGGRKGVDAELKKRVQRLETLVTRLGADTLHDNEPECRITPSYTPQNSNTSSKRFNSTGSAADARIGHLDRYLGSTFWANLSNEVNGIREVLDHFSDDEDEASDHVHSPEGVVAAHAFTSNLTLCSPQTLMAMVPNGFQHPPRLMIDTLCTHYLHNFDCTFKVLHGPTLRHFMQSGEQYLDYPPGDVAIEALSFSIYYAAITTVDETECKRMCGADKSTLLEHYRLAAEIALARADIINTTDISTLQAFAIFLISARINCNSSRLVWTLTATVVRVAHALGLHLDDVGMSLRPFQIEMRRRLWGQIVYLDLKAACDRGTDCIISEFSYKTPSPLNINDADISWDSICPVLERVGFTDMTHTLMTQHAADLMRRLNYLSPGCVLQESNNLEPDWRERQEWTKKYEQVMEEKYLRYCDVNQPFHMFSKLLVHIIISQMSLCAVRPLQRHRKADPPRVKGSTILSLAVEILENAKRLYEEPWAAPWRYAVWVPWHALAVALAELGVQAEGPLVERAWNVVEVIFEYSGEMVADSTKGMLWRPIEKLMKKARANRKTDQASPPAVPAQLAERRAVMERAPDALAQQAQAVSFQAEPAIMQGQTVDFEVIQALPLDFGPLAESQVSSYMGESWADIECPEMAWTSWEQFVNEFADPGAPDPMGVMSWQPSSMT